MSAATRSKDKLSKQAKSLEGGHLYPLPKIERFAHGQLPLLSEVISLIVKQQDAGIIYTDAIHSLSNSLVDHWTQRNVYTIAVLNVEKKLKVHFTTLMGFDKTKRHQPAYVARCAAFNTVATSLFDIICTSNSRLKNLEQLHGVKMLKEDYD